MRRAPRDERERLVSAIDQMALNPFAGDVQPLKGRPNAFRRRVGHWRFFFDVSPERHLVEITHIQRRTTTTYRKQH